MDALTVWPRERERVPFDTAAFNRLVNWLNGQLAAPLTLKTAGGVTGLAWNPATPSLTLGAPVAVSDSLTLANTKYLDGLKADGVTHVHLVRINASDLIEVGATGQRLSLLSSLTNATWLLGRNATNAADVNLLRLNASNVIELGQAATTLTVLSSLTNNTALSARNNAASADVALLLLTAGDIVNLGAAANRLSILSPLTNGVSVNGRNAANSGNVSLVQLDGSDIVQLGASGNRMTVNSPLTNNTPLNGRNAANSASVNLVKLNASDQIDSGAAGTQHNLLGTTIVPVVDPPAADGQLTAGSLVKAFAFISISAGVATLQNNYNIDTVTRNAAGNYTIAWDRDFNSTVSCTLVSIENGSLLIPRINSRTASSFDVHIETTGGVKTDPAGIQIASFGTLS